MQGICPQKALLYRTVIIFFVCIAIIMLLWVLFFVGDFAFSDCLQCLNHSSEVPLVFVIIDIHCSPDMSVKQRYLLLVLLVALQCG